jgi:hypothetical protein
MISNIKNMSLHDKVVYRVAENLLKEGAESIEIGDKVNNAIPICSKLKKVFPKAQIFTYLKDFKIEFISPIKINI